MQILESVGPAEEGERCFHCGEPVPRQGGWSLVIDGAARPMCCPGCAAIAGAIVASGLEGFYRARTELQSNPDNDVSTSLDTALFDDPAFQKTFVATLDEECAEAHLMLPDIRCGACSWLIEGTLRKYPGVQDVAVNVIGSRAVIRWHRAAVSLSTLIRALQSVGYRALPWEDAEQTLLQAKERKRRSAELAVAALGMMQVMMYAVPQYFVDAGDMSWTQHWLMNWASLVLTLPVVTYAARGFWGSAYRALRARQVNMDVPIVLGIATGFLGSTWSLVSGTGTVWFDSITMFVFLLLVSRYLDSKAREHALLATSHLMPALPAVSYLRDPASGELRATPVAGLVVGDVIVVPMGDIIPVDGLILSGDSEVQEAVLTGESRPLLRGRGDRVVAGSTNLSQVLEVRVEAVATHTILSRILRRMDEAMGARTRISRLSDLAAQWFVSALLVIASGTAVSWWFIDPTRVLEITVAVLVVSCPCALALAIPATLAATGRRLALKGVLVLQGQAIEDLAAAETIVFDKTGTLTTGQPALEVAGWSGEPLRDGFLARLVMGLEAQQAHPYAEALVRACADKVGSSLHPHLLEVRHVPGRGVEGRVGAERWRLGTPAFVAELAPHQKPPSSPFGSDMGVSVLGDSSGCHLWFGFKDDLKPDALCLIQALKALGKRIVILSGDRPEVVQSIAERLGGIEAHGGCTPEDKERRVLQWSQRGPVVMVGDGLNDALGFARAGVSIVLGHAARALTRGADLMIPSGKLGVLGEALKASLDARSRIRQNLVWATAYNLFAIPLAMLGLLNPWLAALGMSVSSLVVVINGVRPWKS